MNERRSSQKLAAAGVALLLGALLALVVSNGIVRAESRQPGVACEGGTDNSWPGARMGPGMMGGGMMGGMSGRQTAGPQAFRSNGEGIYCTGLSSIGRRILFQGGPMWLSMHGGGCVSCHGLDGRGGTPVPMGSAIPPDISYYTLVNNHGGHGDGGSHRPYTEELIKRAIVRGIDPEGNRLDPTMPRWDMSDRDLADLIAYLKTFGRTRAELSAEEAHHEETDSYSDAADRADNAGHSPSQSSAEDGHAHDGYDSHGSADQSSAVLGAAEAGQPSYGLLLSLAAVVGLTFGTVSFLKSREAPSMSATKSEEEARS